MIKLRRHITNCDDIFYSFVKKNWLCVKPACYKWR